MPEEPKLKVILLRLGPLPPTMLPRVPISGKPIKVTPPVSATANPILVV